MASKEEKESLKPCTAGRTATLKEDRQVSSFHNLQVQAEKSTEPEGKHLSKFSSGARAEVP